MTDPSDRHQNDRNAARERRLGEALRENLKRRKSQRRGRADQSISSMANDAVNPEDGPFDEGPTE